MNLDKKTLIVGNWKMHLNVQQASLLVHRLNQHVKIHRDIEVVLAPSMLALQPISLEIDRRKFRLATQDAYFKDEGAFTGEVSFAMLSDLAHYGIVGHSSRRLYFGETLELVRDKVAAAIRNGISPIICVGETKPERLSGHTKQVLHDQVVTALQNVTSKDIEQVVIAYEPVWAISTESGEMPTAADVESAVSYIRLQIHELYGPKAASALRIIYGGSANEHDAAFFLELAGVDGLLPGAASLNYRQFAGIIDAAYKLRIKAVSGGQ